jgi:alpha-L-rhamnosidase
MDARMRRLRAAAGIVALAGAALLTSAPAGFAAGPQAAGLKTDGNASPLGIDDAAPRLSWRLSGGDRGTDQTSYEVVVATTQAKAAAGTGDVWDSGRITSATAAAAYAGPPLASRTRYYWSVAVSTTAGATQTWSDPSWFETAYLSASDWKGSWIAGPARPTAPLTTAQASADDSCCLQPGTTLAAAAAAGDTNLKVASVTAMAAGQALTLDGGETVTIANVGTAPASNTTLVAAASAGATTVSVASVTGYAVGAAIKIDAESATISAVGTAAGASTTLFSAAAAGDTNVKLTSVAGFAAGQKLVVDGETVTASAVGTQGRNTTLSAAVAAGDATVKVASVTGLSAGDTITIESESAKIAAVGTAGATGTGLTLTAGLTAAHASGAAVADGGTGVTFTPALASAHAKGAAARGLGSGITFAPALTAAHASGAAVSSLGTGVGVSALTAAHPAGATVVGPKPSDFCRVAGGGTASGSCSAIRPAPMLRKAFDVSPVSAHGAVVTARIYSAGYAYNDLTLNGSDPDNRRLDPGWTNYSDTDLYTTLDVTKLIKQDPASTISNVVATQLGSGQFDEHSTNGDWHWETAEWRATPEVIADLWITYADGTQQLVKSDDSWKVSVDGPNRYDNYYQGETYDARRTISGWNLPTFDAASWGSANVVPGPAGTLKAQETEPTRILATYPASTFKSLSMPKAGVQVYDIGQNRAGWATLSVSGCPAGTSIQVLYAEKLNADGTVNNSGFSESGQLQSDLYLCDGTGTADHPEVWTPQFSIKGFQYVQVSSPSNPANSSGGTPQPLPDGVHAAITQTQQLGTDHAQIGTFGTSDATLNTINSMAIHTVQNCDWGGITCDTPIWEKDPWTGDEQLSAPTESDYYDTQLEYQKDFQDMVDNAVASTGELTLLAPTNALYGHVGQTFKSATNAGATPIWDAFWFVLPWESYQRYGDARALAKTYPMMKKYLLNWIPQWTDKDGDAFHYTLTSGLGDWDPATGANGNAAEGTNVNIPTVISPSSTAYYAYMTKIAADTARALGNTEDAAQFDQIFQNIKADYNAKWWDPTVGYYRENATQIFAQTNQLLPLAFGLVPAAQVKPLEAKLVDDVMSTRHAHEEVGIAGARWFFPVLSQAAHDGVPGAADAAYAVATQTTYPSYGYMDSLGWTTIGEYWEASARSRDHHMFATIGQWFFEDLAGISSTGSGFHQVDFDPTIPSKLDDAHASIQSDRGEISAHWFKVGSNGLEYDVTVPPNTTGVVHVPGSDPSQIGEIGSGSTLVAGSAPGVKLIGPDKDSIDYQVVSGTYKFRVGPTAFSSTSASTPVGGSVPATLSLTLGGAPSFGAFAPGVERTYSASMSADVVSTAGDAALSVSDPGHLANGAFSLPDALQVSFSKSGWTAPVSHDAVTIAFSQHIGADDALRTGAYSKALRFTLSTTTP